MPRRTKPDYFVFKQQVVFEFLFVIASFIGNWKKKCSPKIRQTVLDGMNNLLIMHQMSANESYVRKSYRSQISRHPTPFGEPLPKRLGLL